VLYILYIIHVIICVFLILVVLLQQGSGADLSVFGGGATQAAFGARSATNLLHKLTVVAFVGFILTTIAIGFIKMGGPRASVMTDVPVSEAPAPVQTEEPASAPAAESPPASAVEEAVPAEQGEPTPSEGGSAAGTEGEPSDS
jgi:preprotein translocase subunit SecG